MTALRLIISWHRSYLSLYLVYILAMAGILLAITKGEEVIFFSTHHSLLLDFFFVACSKLAEGWVILMLAMILLVFRIKYLFVYLINLAVVSGVVQFLKLEIFPHADRPAIYFDGKVALNQVAGVQQLLHYSFPSGHTTLAFATFFLLVLLIQKGWADVLLLLLSILVAISRIYLLQHFLADVLAGSLLGVMIASIIYLICRERILDSKARFLNWSLFDSLSKK